MKNLTPQTYLDIGKQVRSEVLKNYSADSCIATTQATLGILRGLGVDAYALPVVCMVANRALWEYADAHGEYPAVGSAEYPEGGYGIGVGFGLQAEKEGGRWAGHLVAIAERKWLLDFSIDQAARVDHDIELGPVVVPVTESWLRGAPRILTFGKDGVRLHYFRKTGEDAERYKESNNWIGEHAPTVQIRRTTDRTEGRKMRRRLVR